MTDTDINTHSHAEDFEFEPCDEINEGEARAALEGTRGPWSGLIQDAPGCSTSIVNGLSQQLIHQMNVITANILVSCDDLNVDLESAAWPFIQPPAKEALARAIKNRGKTLKINSAYRTIAQQFLLYKWGRGCGYGIVATPGKSNHQSGLALDIDDSAGWRPYLEAQGWKWFGPKDPPHFDYISGGKDIRGTAMLAFQKLWNKNNPNAKILEDGVYGNQVESCLNKSPAEGFNIAPWDEHPRTLRLCKPMLQGSDVQKVQAALIKAGCATDTDGIFGQKMDSAVKQYQQQQGLVVDGIVGPATLSKLLSIK
ncbi:MAG TPA: peptidoglycan-binding protein [Leptolyngbyaceae cyanobacterium]